MGKAKEVFITERDKALLRDVGKDGIGSFEYLKECYWPHTTPASCRARLSQLSQAGYLEWHYVSSRRKAGELAFFLAPRAYSLFSRGEREQFMRLRPGEYKQQLMAQQSRLILSRQLAEEGKRLVEWKHEHQIKAEWSKTTAAALTKGQRVAEVELPDCQATIALREGQTYQLDIEIDGAYHGKYLATKSQGLLKNGRPVVWVTMGQRRATNLRQVLPAAMQLLVLD
jgi:hypothetical protein